MITDIYVWNWMLILSMLKRWIQDVWSDMDVDGCDCEYFDSVWHENAGGRQDGRPARLGHQLTLPPGDQHHPVWLPHVIGSIS